MKTPFKNDIFALIWQAFKNLYPDKECECFWEPNIRDDKDGNEAFGMTDFAGDGTVTVFVRTSLSISDAATIFAHELAHVAVGFEHGHNEVWKKAFDDIFDEYNRIGNEMFPGHTEATP